MSKHQFARALVATVVFAAAPVYAGFTKVAGPLTQQPTQSEILSQIYGGSFSGDGESYSNGTVTAERIADFDAPETDQIWKAGKYVVRSVAKFTSEESRFYASNPMNPQVIATDYGYATGSPVTITTPADFYFTARNYYGTSSTDVSMNSDAADHFVTYQIQTEGAPKYVLFWEDLPQTRTNRNSEASWSDFNDLVLEVQSAAPNGAVIPLPPAAFAGGATMAVFAVGNFLRNRFRRSH